jgi:hypothetical protein
MNNVALVIAFLLAGCGDAGRMSGQATDLAGAPVSADLAGVAVRGDLAAVADFARSGSSLDLLMVAMTPVTINFDNLPMNHDVTTQYAAHATFSTDPGGHNLIGDVGAVGQSQPNYLCTCWTGTSLNTYVDFAAPVEQLTFRGLCINTVGKAAQVNVFTNGARAGVFDVVGTGDCAVGVKYDLSAYHRVTRIEIVNITDNQGIGWDDFTFLFPGP